MRRACARSARVIVHAAQSHGSVRACSPFRCPNASLMRAQRACERAHGASARGMRARAPSRCPKCVAHAHAARMRSLMARAHGGMRAVPLPNCVAHARAHANARTARARAACVRARRLVARMR
eukprot:1057945-Pleurochrysis_carterae.AAC.1